MRVWWMTINRAMGNTYLNLKHRKVIAQGWPYLGDLSSLVYDFEKYRQGNRSEFENRLLRLIPKSIYSEELDNPPIALLNFYNLFSIAKGDLVVAVESAQGAGPVMGICQAEQNAWESYRHDNPGLYDYAQTVCYPVNWVDWKEIGAKPPRSPSMISGVSPMGTKQAAYVQDVWLTYKSN